MAMVRYAAVLLAGLLCTALVNAQDVSICHKERDKEERRQCYDRVSGYKEPTETTRPSGILAELWGYDTNSAESRYRLSQYERNYVTFDYTPDPNTMPQSPTHPSSGGYPPVLDPVELGFQLSAKARVLDLGPTKPGVYDEKDHYFGVWLAYTQQSFWQIFNGSQSSPFRETDYQPEVIFAFRPNLFMTNPRFGDVDWRLLNVGLVHQSNGQSDPLSRSWNRIYAQFGFEKQDSNGGDWALLLRPWYRFKEQPSKDDNPDIEQYLGHGDIRLLYRNGAVNFSFLGRGNVNTGKGAAQVDVAFPLALWKSDVLANYPFKWYMRLFSGYGESLIDYNVRQTTFSVGITLNDWP